MRNYNQKQHPKPLTQNSFKKTDRVYPQQVKLQRTSLQKPKRQLQPKLTQNIILSKKTMAIIPHHQKQNSQKYFLNLQQPFNMFDRDSNTTYTDPFCLWFRHLQKQPQSVKRKLTIKKISYMISDWAQDEFPMVLFLTVQGIWGYLNQQNIPTNRVMALSLKKQTVFLRNGVYTYDLLYQSVGDCSWEIPSQLTQIYMGVSDQNSQKIQLPLPNPIILEVQINSIPDK